MLAVTFDSRAYNNCLSYFAASVYSAQKSVGAVLRPIAACSARSYVFLKKLPLHRKVIVDMSNYSGMGTMFYDAFDEYRVNRKNVYWLNPTFKGLIDLYKSGIKQKRIISQKTLVITKKDGREVFSLKDN